MASAVAVFAYSQLSPVAAVSSTEPQSQRRSQPARRGGPQNVKRAARINYANFSHRTKEHQKACNDCHKFPSKNWKEVRKGDEAFPDVTEFPEHAACLECHRPQFFARERPAPRICSNCHVRATPRYTARFPFPSLTGFSDNPARGKDAVSDFGVSFPHDKHVDLVGWKPTDAGPDRSLRFVHALFKPESAHARAEGEPPSCAVCHQTYLPQGKSDEEYMTARPKNLAEDAFWLKKGTFKTTPLNHATCFTCHSEETGITPAPSSCNVCHQLRAAAEPPLRADFDQELAATMGVTDRIILSKWRKRDSSGAFRHEIHQDQNCVTCHKLPTMNTMDAKSLRVGVQSCSGEGCHVTPTSDEGGALNYEVDMRNTKPTFQCSKCHLILGREPVPETHLNAISALNKK